MKIVVLGGGISTEREVSLVSATSICRALRSLGHRAVFVDMFFGLEDYGKPVEAIFDEPDGLCGAAVIHDEEPDIGQVIAARKYKSPSRLGRGVLEACQLADCVYLGLHGADGEDGKIQAALDLLGVPYTGSGHLGSAMAMDKAVAKRVMAAAGILTPGWEEYEVRVEEIEALADKIKRPCVIKVIDGGSSIGVYITDTREQVVTALHEVVKYGARIVVEDKIVGRELTVPVLEGEALAPIEIVPPDSGTFDYVAKYQSGDKAAREICPAPIDEELKLQVQKIALQVHETLGLAVLSRSDFIVDDRGRAWCLEVNTLPGMTPASLIPKAAKLAGMDYPALCERIVLASLEKNN